jgi:hypothetical protein
VKIMNKDQDQAFENSIDGINSLSEEYSRSSREQPAAQIDDAILAASRKAVNAAPRVAYSPFSSNWHVPVSLAAVLVICVTLVVSIQQAPNMSTLDYQDTSIQETVALNAPEKKSELMLKGQADRLVDADNNNAVLVDRVESIVSEDDSEDFALFSPVQDVIQDARNNEVDELPSFVRNVVPQSVVSEPLLQSEEVLESAVAQSPEPRRREPALLRRSIIPPSEQEVASLEESGSLTAVGAASGTSLRDDAAQTDGRVLAEIQAESVDVPAVRILEQLVGVWEGSFTSSAQETVVTFNRNEADCVYGIETGDTSPSWILCDAINNTRLTLTGQLIDKEGLIEFIQTSNNGNTFLYEVQGSGQQEFLIEVNVVQERINVLNNGNLFLQLRKIAPN